MIIGASWGPYVGLRQPECVIKEMNLCVISYIEYGSIELNLLNLVLLNLILLNLVLFEYDSIEFE